MIFNSIPFFNLFICLLRLILRSCKVILMFRIRNIRNSPFPASQRNWFGALKHCSSTGKIYIDTYFIPNFYNTTDSDFGSVSDISTESNYSLTFSVSEFDVFDQVLDSKIYFAEKSMIDAQLHSLSNFVNSTKEFDSEFEEFQNLSVSSVPCSFITVDSLTKSALSESCFNACMNITELSLPISYYEVYI